MKNSSPYISVWFNTADTLVNILTNKIRFYYQIPVILSVSSTFLLQLFYNADLGLPASLLIFIIGCVIGYLFLIIILPWLITVIGKLWQGKSSVREIRIAISLSQIPYSIVLLQQIIHSAAGNILAKTDVNPIIHLVTWIFMLRILIIGISKVQGFNHSKALMNLVISILPFILLTLSLF